MRKTLLLFILTISTFVALAQSRVDSFLVIINDSKLKSSEVRDKIQAASFYVGKPLSAQEYAILNAAFFKKINSPEDGNDKLGFYQLELDYYLTNQEIGKALVIADEYLKWAKSTEDTTKIREGYFLHSRTYAHYGIAKEWLEFERKAFYLSTKKSDLNNLNIPNGGGYGWTLSQVGWTLKDTVLMDSAAFFLGNAVQYALVNVTKDTESLKNNSSIYCMTLARLKRYPALINVSRQMIEWNKKLPATQDEETLDGRQKVLSVFNGWIGKAFTRSNQKDSAFYYFTLPEHFFPEHIPDHIYYPKNGKYIRWDAWTDIIDYHVNFKQYKEAADLLAPVVFDKNSKLTKFIKDYLYEKSAPIFEKAGRKDEAIICYVQAKMINDSLQKINDKLIEEEKYTSTRLQIAAVKEAAELLNEKIKLEAQKELEKQKMVRNGFMGGFAVVLIFASVFFTQRNQIKKGKKLSDELLLNILPAEVAEELKAKGSAEAQLIDEVTVLFTDFKGFTALSEKLTPKELVHDLNDCFSAFDRIMEKYGMEKIKTIGDAYMAAGGLPTVNTTHATDAVKAAIEIRDFIAKGKQQKLAAGLPYFEIRIGMHTGSVVAGIVGVKKFAYDIWGDTVNTASRMESSGEAGMINISETTYTLVKDTFKCNYRGEIEAKGKGKVKMYFVEEYHNF